MNQYLNVIISKGVLHPHDLQNWIFLDPVMILTWYLGWGDFRTWKTFSKFFVNKTVLTKFWYWRSRSLWKKFSSQNMRKKWNSKWDWNILTKPHVLSWNFFQSLLENFLWTLRTYSMYLKGPHNLNLCVSKKIVTARQNSQIIC